MEQYIFQLVVFESSSVPDVKEVLVNRRQFRWKPVFQRGSRWEDLISHRGLVSAGGSAGRRNHPEEGGGWSREQKDVWHVSGTDGRWRWRGVQTGAQKNMTPGAWIPQSLPHLEKFEFCPSWESSGLWTTSGVSEMMRFLYGEWVGSRESGERNRVSESLVQRSPNHDGGCPT